jgi:hypothetical protein
MPEVMNENNWHKCKIPPERDFAFVPVNVNRKGNDYLVKISLIVST